MYMLNKFVCRHLYIYKYVETPEANTGYCFSDVSNVMTKYHHKVTERRQSVLKLTVMTIGDQGNRQAGRQAGDIRAVAESLYPYP